MVYQLINRYVILDLSTHLLNTGKKKKAGGFLLFFFFQKI